MEVVVDAGRIGGEGAEEGAGAEDKDWFRGDRFHGGGERD